MKTLQTGYIEGVNLARIVGAIGIIVFHYGCHNGILSPYLCSYANDSWGRVLVAVFLAISGACLARTYASDFEWKHYFGRRWKAIYPMFYLCYLFFFVEAAISVGTWWKSGIPYYRFVYTLLGIDGYIAPLQPNFSLVGDWFLGPIIICYLLFPALLLLLILSINGLTWYLMNRQVNNTLNMLVVSISLEKNLEITLRILLWKFITTNSNK